MDEKVTLRCKDSHQKIVAKLRDAVQQRLGEIDLAKQGRFNTAARLVMGRGDRQAALAAWKQQIRAAWKRFKRVAKAAPEWDAYKRYLGSPSSMSYIMIDYLVWPNNNGHTKNGEFELAVQQLTKLLHGD